MRSGCSLVEPVVVYIIPQDLVGLCVAHIDELTRDVMWTSTCVFYFLKGGTNLSRPLSWHVALFLLYFLGQGGVCLF